MKKILMLLAQGVEPLEMAAFTDVFGWTSLLSDFPIAVIDVGLRKKIVTTFGLKLEPNYLLKDINLNEFDALALPGGFEPSGFYKDAFSEDFLNVIKFFDKQNKPIASVCVSSLALGKAHILNGKKATTYHQIGGKRKSQLVNFGTNFIDKPIIIDGNIITSSGPGTALEVAFKLLEMLTNKQNMQDIKQKMRMPKISPDWYFQAQV
ncbi:DJ-1/PfpI family protein [Pseudoalteromonas denitrificans]|jgi:4-methyl-5(b-hydroxyethyl)-thiazole monophosphate biosynthesis|uniref:4-methyl-5(B-hydroxyethyl)-thiazole monophosphate biosynthesis n=1 Tax=Pseudoalteromonas denitrificans DSM 6059 TaxID=1123010 RepID=A0A1I1G501_9GAMM|nr:DJ-1/PfpI family protein [Pseudoalteromonas denitrificans]SFC06909.1 4-methyl-5(b-hydroxyethyl)-thiazole monophosphate biosynthesis [Pseudoalteromonas denitrificans DSM 6059]